MSKESPKSNQEPPEANRSQVIRLRKGQAHKLGEISEQFGTSQGQLVSWAVEALIKQVEQNGGRLMLPLEFKEAQVGEE